MAEKTLKNAELQRINSKYIAIGTIDIRLWSSDDAEPFIIPLDTEDDFENNGFDYENYKDMAVGESKDSCCDYEGIIVIRIR